MKLLGRHTLSGTKGWSRCSSHVGCLRAGTIPVIKHDALVCGQGYGGHGPRAVAASCPRPPFCAGSNVVRVRHAVATWSGMLHTGNKARHGAAVVSPAFASADEEESLAGSVHSSGSRGIWHRLSQTTASITTYPAVVLERGAALPSTKLQT